LTFYLSHISIRTIKF